MRNPPVFFRRSSFVKYQPQLGIVLVTLLIAALYGWTSLTTSDGRPVAPLDDTYIHLQYARQIARGHPWQYNDGDPRSTGATSPLYPFLLAVGYVLGFSGERLVWFALSLGGLSLALSAWLTHRITAQLLMSQSQDQSRLARWAPAGAALFFLLTGAVQWTFFSGMESGLFTVFILASLNAFLTQRASPNTHLFSSPAFWIGLAALTRPEGLIMAGVLWLVVVRQSLCAPRGTRIMFSITLAVLIGIAPLLLNLILTGSPVASGAQAKSWLGNVPFRPWDILHSIAENYRRILAQFTAGMLASQPWFLAPGMLIFAGMGWIALLRHRQWGVVILSGVWFVLGTLATAVLITATWQVGRYQVPFAAVLTPFATLGIVTLSMERSYRWRTGIATCLSLALLVAALVSTFQARSLYQRAIRTVSQQQLVLADWIHDHLSSDARVGVHDTGAIRYVGQRSTYDMIGLTTQGAATPWRHGAGAVFEQMERSPARPTHFATYPDVFSVPYLATTDLFATELFRVNLPDFAVASAGPLQAVYQADWHLGGSGDRLHQTDMLRRTHGLVLFDRLDLADLQDENAHELSFWERTVRPGFPTEVQQFRYRTDPTIEVLDGGRLVNGGLTFRVAAQAGQPLLLVARLHAARRGAVQVVIDGHAVGRWPYPTLRGEWLETAFQIPAEAVTRDNVEIRLEVDTVNPTFRHFALYYLWIWQGDPSPFQPSPDQPLSAWLGDAVQLIGYDLLGTTTGERTYHPGETIRLVLYWRALAGPTEDAKVFVHLYDEKGEIVAQQDRRPYYGTRPPYTWWPGEALDDPYTLQLPPDLSPGQYTLATGMYHAATWIRLPVAVAEDHGLSDNRISLTKIEVSTETE